MSLSLIFHWQKKGGVEFLLEMQQSISASLSRPWLSSLGFRRRVWQGEGCGWGTRCQQSLLLGCFFRLGFRDKGRWLVKTSGRWGKNGSRRHSLVGNWVRSEDYGENELHRCNASSWLSPDSNRLSGTPVRNSAAQRWPDSAHVSKSRLIIWELKRFFDIGQM